MALPKAQTISENEKQQLSSIPSEYELKQNYPNPFNPSTTITYAIPVAGKVTLSIYNLHGQLIRTLASGMAPAGRYKAVWDGRDTNGGRVASGLYVYRLEASDFMATKKLVLAK